MDDKNKGQQMELHSYLGKRNHFVLYVYQRISKVAQAIYIITDIIKDAEPLKWTLRKSATEASNFRHYLDEQDVLNTLERSLLELEGMLEFGRNVRVLSEMNAFIIQDQIKKLINEIKEGAKGSYSKELDYRFFDTQKPTPLLPSDVFGTSLENKDLYKSHKGHNVLYDFYTPSPVKKAPAANVKRELQPTKEKDERKEEMLRIIKGIGEVTIKDLRDKIKDRSEKTIQRDLIQMVSDGVLKKTGERRWSKYSAL
jgi:hypothetical protein